MKKQGTDDYLLTHFPSYPARKCAESKLASVFKMYIIHIPRSGVFLIQIKTKCTPVFAVYGIPKQFPIQKKHGYLVPVPVCKIISKIIQL